MSLMPSFICICTPVPLQAMVAVGLSALGLVMAVCLVSMHSASTVALVNFPEHTADGQPISPPLMDHISRGVGNEDRIERRANWALKVIGKMDGTGLQAMIANGTIDSEGDVVDPELVEEVHEAMDSQNKEVVRGACPVVRFIPDRCPPRRLAQKLAQALEIETPVCLCL
jgi:hypothetical protein